jgi:hypothetical protein
MSPEADQLLAIALKKVSLRDGFSPAELGARVGLSKSQSQLAARALADAGVLVIGFDHSAEFSDDYRRKNTAVVVAPPKKRARPAKASSGARKVASASAHGT